MGTSRGSQCRRPVLPVLRRGKPLQETREFPHKSRARQDEIAAGITRGIDEGALDVRDETDDWEIFCLQVRLKSMQNFQCSARAMI